ncbi:hypothetical protein SIO70_30410 [Chitinophaga sancti]|uniref:hypothetical protein n=1 Tax=Chitinophaga sancti TaxID=1004 RepID=UPI002A7537CF|nr:hypothetical protein [Chitinophaga sancti]WPQ62675.1 hypothetical protein SIO70_30410 [Chitinophaga sancti]
MNKFKLFVCYVISSSIFLITAGQQKAINVNWDLLQNIQFKERFVKEIGGYMLFPTFPVNIKKLNGTEVIIEGYVVPFDIKGEKIALSANSYAACYFCGKAGPASVMTINLKVSNKKYRTDQYRTFKGKLRLNENDINEFYYIMDDAVQIKN